MKSKPNFYSILPADVRYSSNINSMEKLLFAEISALCNYKGYCWASNKYFGELFKKHPGSISRNLSKLALHGFIKIQLVKEGKHTDSRRISLIHNPSEKVYTYPKQYCEEPLNKNVKHNNKKEKHKLFEEFWDAYNFKKSRKLCYTKFMQLSLTVCKKCVVAAKAYSESITDVKYKKHPSTWLNQGCWDDEIQDKNQQGFTGGGFENMVF
jgi:hypothetical protein